MSASDKDLLLATAALLDTCLESSASKPADQRLLHISVEKAQEIIAKHGFLKAYEDEMIQCMADKIREIAEELPTIH
jgi:hypothetical protein